MTHRIRQLATVAAVACTFASARVQAQVSCDSLPNPVVVAGSTAFDAVVQQFIVKLAAESPSTTFVYPALSKLAASCAGIASIVNAMDLGGVPGRYYTVSGTTLTANSCVFAAGQTVDVAISEVFYETCSE